jgi:predicted transcriptional regulator
MQRQADLLNSIQLDLSLAIKTVTELLNHNQKIEKLWENGGWHRDRFHRLSDYLKDLIEEYNMEHLTMETLGKQLQTLLDLVRNVFGFLESSLKRELNCVRNLIWLPIELAKALGLLQSSQQSLLHSVLLR